jgi:multidrug efflux pump
MKSTWPAGRDGVNQSLMGFSFSGRPERGLAFTMLKDWKERNGATAAHEVELAQAAMASAREGMVMSVMPPAIEELGNSSGFSLRLQDRGNRACRAAGGAGSAAGIGRQEQGADRRVPGRPAARFQHPAGDRPPKAEALGVPFSAISDTLSSAMGSTYVNDFPNAGRMQQVIVQADAARACSWTMCSPAPQ